MENGKVSGLNELFNEYATVAASKYTKVYGYTFYLK